MYKQLCMSVMYVEEEEEEEEEEELEEEELEEEELCSPCPL